MSQRAFFFALAGVMIAVVIFTRIYFPTKTGGEFQRQGALPAFAEEGWINGPGPTAEELKGKVLVIDLWAFWCGPCKRAVPEIIALKETFAPKGVIFLGVTNEGKERLKESEAFVKETAIPWPNAYGAESFFDELSVEGIPTILVVGRDGQIVWREHHPEGIEKAIEKALAEVK